MMKSKEPGKGMQIFFLALLTVYFVITTAVAVLFEYYTVSESRGEIIFSLSMSWQLLLFVFELATIVIQALALIKSMKEATAKRYNIIRYTGLAAGLIAIIVAVILVITQGFVVNPTVIYAVYALLILIVRGILLPKTVRNTL